MEPSLRGVPRKFGLKLVQPVASMREFGPPQVQLSAADDGVLLAETSVGGLGRAGQADLTTGRAATINKRVVALSPAGVKPAFPDSKSGVLSLDDGERAAARITISKTRSTGGPTAPRGRQTDRAEHPVLPHVPALVAASRGRGNVR